MKTIVCALCVLGGLFLASRQVVAAPMYNVTVLGQTQADAATRYNGINNSGVVVFNYVSPNTGVVWQNGNLSYISASTISPVVGLSNNGIVAGNGGGAPYAAATTVGSQNLIPSVPQPFFGGVATSINGNGSLVTGYGYLDSAQSYRAPALWNLSNGRCTRLDVDALYPYNFGQANSVNNSGIVVGLAGQRGASQSSATIWNADGSVVDLGMGNGSHADFVNNNGVIIGFCPGYDTTYQGAFMLSGGVVTNLNNNLGSTTWALAINDSEQVVGCSHGGTAQLGQFPQISNTGWLWEDGTTINLNDVIPTGTGLWVYQACGINNNGLILAEAGDVNGNNYALLLTPVPEPTTLSLLGLGFLVALRRRRKL